MLFRLNGQALRVTAQVIVFMALLEVCARLDDAVTWGAPFFGEYSNTSLSVIDALGPRCRPNGQFEKWKLNSYGFRGPEVTPAKSPGVTRIMVVGASETFGLYESPGNEYPAEMQRQLRRGPKQFEVINAACAGMSPPRIAQLLDSLLGRFRPDYLLYYPSPQFYLDEQPPTESRRTAPDKESLFVPRLG